MRCCKNGDIKTVDLEQDLNDSNLRKGAMAIQTNVLDQIGGQVQFGRRQDLFWIIIAVLATSILAGISIFRKPKRRR